MKSQAIFKKISLAFTGLAVLYFLWVLLTLPSFNGVKTQALGSSQILLAKNKQILQVTRTDMEKRRRLWMSRSGFSESLQQTIIKLEDKNFYSHWGVDFLALLRAFYHTLVGQRVQGASTISMQTSDLIRDSVLFGNQQIIKGHLLTKVEQVVRGFALDLLWSKEEILEAYLNLVHLKGEVQGVHSFSMAYLKKSPFFIDTNESLLIANLIQFPNRKKASLKHRTCLYAQKDQPQLSCDQLDRPLQLIFNGPYPQESLQNLAPHLARKLIKQYPDQQIFETTIDFDLQRRVQQILEKNLSYLQGKNVHDSAAIVIHNQSGEVRAYVGAIPKYSLSPYVDGVDSPRQAGSTLKPFLYGQAIDKKLITASSLIEDEDMAIHWEGGIYRPSNYDNKFHGTVTVRQALASSLNVPAIKVVRMLKLGETFRTIKNLKFSEMGSPDHYGASLALGAVGVKLWELANAYRGLAMDGAMTPLKLSLDPEISIGRSSQILSPEAAFIIKDVLSDPNARRLGFNWNSALETRMWSAVKTGTSKDLRDNWCVGFSSEYTVGVWTGNFDGSGMKKVSGVTGAGPSWNEIIHEVHRNEKSQPPTPPSQLIAKRISIENMQSEQTEYYLSGTQPQIAKISKGLLQKIRIDFPADGSVLTLNPQINQTSARIVVRLAGNIPQGGQIIFDGKPQEQTRGHYVLENVMPGKHLLQIVDSQKNKLVESQFKVF